MDNNIGYKIPNRRRQRERGTLEKDTRTDFPAILMLQSVSVSRSEQWRYSLNADLPAREKACLNLVDHMPRDSNAVHAKQAVDNFYAPSASHH